MNSLYILILCAIVGPTFSLPEEGKWDVVVTAVSKYNFIYIILLLMPRRFSEQSSNNSKKNCVQGS